MIVSTKQYINIQTKLNLYIAKFGCETIEMYLDNLPLKVEKRDGKHLGNYIESKVCEEYKITHYELFESSKRKEISQARQLLCVFTEKYLHISRTDISLLFRRSRHFAKRLITDFNKRVEENHPFDKKLLERYKRLDTLISAYIEFSPKDDKQ
jgi:chromosomal replication initiation ATPase DnaA